MFFGLIKRKDPICGMKESEDSGTRKFGLWFCSSKCLEEYSKQREVHRKKDHSCCH